MKSYFCRSESNIYGRLESFPSVSYRSSNYQITLRSRSTFQNLESTMWLAKHGKGMLSSVEQAFVGRDEKRASLKSPAWEAKSFLTACISLVHEPDKPCSSQQPSCTNSQKEVRRCCSPIGHNNAKRVWRPIRSQYSLDRLEMVRWESVPRGSSARAWKLSSRLFSRPDWLPLGLRGWGSVPPKFETNTSPLTKI